MPKQYYKKRQVQHFARTQTAHTSLVLHGFGRGSILLALSVIIASGFYVFIINASAVRGSEMHTLEQDVAQQERLYEELSIRVAQNNTIRYAEEIIETYKMSPIGDVEYISGTPDHILAFITTEF